MHFLDAERHGRQKMKEFEEWWNKVLKMSWSPQDKGVCYCAWKAALETVKSKIDYANAGNDMIDWIFEEELDATS